MVCNVPPFTQTPLAFTCGSLFTNPDAAFGTFLTSCCGDNPPAVCQGYVENYNAAAPAPFTINNYCDCPNLLTPDFGQYIVPAATCLQGDPQANFQECLQCVSKFSAKFNCNSGPEVCEEDDAVNFITAMPCEGGVQTDGCVCDACGDVCGTQCKAQIQTSLSCQIGSPFAVVENEDGDFVETGS